MRLAKRYGGGFDALRHDAYAQFDRLRSRFAGKNFDDGGEILFIHIPKCAGVSLRHALNLPNRGHRLLCDFDSSELERAQRIVCCTRDPFTRAVSAFNYVHHLWRQKPGRRWLINITLPDSFTEFVHSPLLERLEAYHYFFRSQFQYLKGIERYGDKTVHLRFESLANDFERELGGTLGRMNIAMDKALADGVDTPANRERVRSIYRADYDLLPQLFND